MPRWLERSFIKFQPYRTFFVTLFGGAAVILACWGMWIWTCSMGRSAIVEIAKERGYCQIDDCLDGIEHVEGVLAERTDLSPSTIEWCIGVDEWRKTRVHRGGLIKAILVDFMDAPCNALKAKPADQGNQ